MLQICLSAVAAAGLVLCVRAEEITLKDGRVFKDAQVVSQSPTKVMIRYPGGVSSVAKSLLPESLLVQYPVDEKGAAEVDAAEANRLAQQPKIPQFRLTNGRILSNVRITGQSAGRVWITDGQTGESVDKRLLPQWLRQQYPIDAEALAQANAEAGMSLAANKADPTRQSATDKGRIKAVTVEAREYAETYFRYRYPVGSGTIFVVSLKLQMGPPSKVEGWQNRFSVEGRCHMEYYDSADRSLARHVSDAFMLTLEGKTINGAEDFKVVDFSKHYAPVDNLP
jgi:hypothetical protein